MRGWVSVVESLDISDRVTQTAGETWHDLVIIKRTIIDSITLKHFILNKYWNQ